MRRRVLFCLLVLSMGLCAITISKATLIHNTGKVIPRHSLHAVSALQKAGLSKKWQTADFSIDASNVSFVQPFCLGGNGSITGLVIKNNTAVTYNWTANGKTIGTTLDLLNVSAGTYILTVTTTDQQYTHTYGPVTLTNAIASINVANLTIVPSTCGQANGAITGIKVKNADRPAYQLIDAIGNIISTSLDTYNLPPGNYRLLVTQPVCGLLQYSNLVVPNKGGPVIDDSNVVITNNDCTNSGGAIKNIKATGKGVLNYTWISSVNNSVVGNEADLEVSGLGMFFLKVTDDSGCGPSYSKVFTVTMYGELPGFVLTNFGTIVKATCSTNASVTGITIDHRMFFEWFDNFSGASVARTADLLDVNGGNYTLAISDACGYDTSYYQFDLGIRHMKLNPFQAVIKNSCPGQNSGAISLNGYFGVITSSRWLDASNNVIGTATSLTGLAPGSYRFFVTDVNNCETLNQTCTIIDAAAPVININNIAIINDRCNTRTASIKGVKADGGTPPYTYIWTNAAGDTIAKKADLDSIGEGTYKLTLMDFGSCPYSVKNFNVINVDVPITAPLLKDVNICTGNNATLVVEDYGESATGYRLYQSNTDIVPIDEQTKGRFNVTILKSTSFYVSRVSGNCESVRTKINVNLSIPVSSIPNVISPNSDGINDTWKIPGIEYYINEVIQIYDRSGRKIFNSVGYSKPFDGTYNGKQLPTGTYYYIINLNSGCGLLSGSLTIIR